MFVAISEFVRRQTPESEFSHWTLTDLELLDRVILNWEYRKAGYRDGVVLIPLDHHMDYEGFFSGVVCLEKGAKLVGEYAPRQEGEEPRKRTYTIGEKETARGVDLVCYRADVLDENDERSSDAEWEIISVNARPTRQPMEIGVGTLLANHFEISGGTATGMSDEELVKQLKKSFMYWRDKALCKPKE